MDAHSLESFRECKLNLLEILKVETEDWMNDHYKQLIKKAGNEAKLIITTASHYLLQLRDELKDFKEILRKLNIKMAEQVVGITSRGLFIDGETLSLNGKEDLSSLKSDEFRFEFGDAKCLLDRQVQIKLNLDIKKSIKQTREILDKVDDDIMVNTVAVEKLEDFIQKWAEKVIEEETTDQLEESKKDEVENGDRDTKEADGKENAGKEKENEAGKLEDKSETSDSTDEKHSEIDDRANIETLAEDKKSESDTNDGMGEETLTQEIDNDLNDTEKPQGSTESLMSTEEERQDGGSEKDDDENDEVTANGGVSEDENALENTESDENKEDRLQDIHDVNINDGDGEEVTHYANMNGDDNGEDRRNDHKDEDIETLMLNELQEHPDQEPDNPFPAEDWDTFVYYRPIKHSDSEAEEVMCAVIVKREMLRQSDIMCSVSKNPNDLRACLKNKYEKLLSYFVTVKFLREPVDMGECFVFVPYHQPSKTLQHVIRTRSPQGQWADVTPKNISNLTSLPGVKLSGIEVHEKDPFGLIVVAKENQIRCSVPKEGIAIEPENDRNMTILVSPVTFGGETCISFSTEEVSIERLEAYKKDNSEFMHVSSVDARLHIVCDEATEDDLSVVFYDLLRIENSKSDDFRSPEKEALRQCWRRLVNGLDVEKLLEQLEERRIPAKSRSKIDSVNFRQKIENEESMGDKARLLLREIEQWNKEDINGFVVCLRESKQSYLAKIFAETVDKIAKELKSTTGNTMQGNPEIKTLVRKNDGPWVPSNPVTISERPEDFVLVLPPGGREYQIIVLHLSGQMMKRDLCAFGDVLSNDVSGTRTSLICRQHSKQPEKITIQCVRSEAVASRIKHLEDNGYTYGWEEDIQFGMCDGESLEITFDLNLGLVDIGEDGVLRMYYFSYLDTAQFVGDLFLVDERAQSQEPLFSGDLCYNVGAVKQRPPRSGCIKVTLPKSAAPYIDRTPFRMLHVQVIALAKYIGFRLSALGRDSVLQFASSLVEDEALRRRLYVKVRRVCRGKDDAARCEMFIINWARQRLKFENKAILLIDALGFEPDIQADVKDFSLIYSDSGVLCDHYLQRMSEFIGEEWISLGRNLGIPDRDLRLLQIDFKDKAERNYKLLDTFRLSRTAIEQGTGVIRFLLRACKGAGCIAGLITFIRYIAGIFKEQTFMRSQSWMSLSSAMPSVEIT